MTEAFCDCKVKQFVFFCKYKTKSFSRLRAYYAVTKSFYNIFRGRRPRKMLLRLQSTMCYYLRKFGQEVQLCSIFTFPAHPDQKATAMKRYLPALAGLLLLAACQEAQPPSEAAHMPSLYYHYTDENLEALPARELIYVPVYSDIYHMSGEQRFLLTATLSVRNASLTDTVFLGRIDYYDSHGNRSRQYLERPIFLHPLEAAEFVVEHKEDRGGAGASFLVEWRARKPAIRPVI
jgi:hypothetical protein